MCVCIFVFTCVRVCMYVRMYVSMDACTDRWMDRWMDGCIDSLNDVWRKDCILTATQIRRDAVEKHKARDPKGRAQTDLHVSISGCKCMVDPKRLPLPLPKT